MIFYLYKPYISSWAYYLLMPYMSLSREILMKDYSAEYNFSDRDEFPQTKKQANKPFHICNESFIVQTVKSKGPILVMDEEECILSILLTRFPLSAILQF